MGRKPKFSKEVKIEACERYINGHGSFRSIVHIPIRSFIRSDQLSPSDPTSSSIESDKVPSAS
jgi:hypothetical protein